MNKGSTCSVGTATDAGAAAGGTTDTIKRLMSSPKCRSVEVINNPARPGLNHMEINYIIIIIIIIIIIS
jgi:hypothetical protein